MFFRYCRPLACGFVALLFPILAHASSITGTIIDADSHSPLPGVRIAVVGTHTGAISGLDGTYIIRNLHAGKYSLHITYSTYRDTNVKVDLASEDAMDTVDVALLPFTMSGGNDVTVSAKAENGSDVSTLERVRTSENVINAVSARSIEISPDINVADVSQRVSGVSMTRAGSTGAAQYAIIRGMDRRYNYTTVNGIKIPSPDNKNRYVPLDIFPSELLDRLEVYKTLTPSMEGDAIGGAMNLVLKQAPDHLVLNAKIASGYDGLFFYQKFNTVDFHASSESPRVQFGNDYTAPLSAFPLSNFNPQQIQAPANQYYALTYGNRFLDNDALGVIVSGTYQRNARGANSIYFPTTADQATSLPYLTDEEYRTYSTMQTREAAMANIDYRADPNNTLQLFGMYANLNALEQRDNSDTVLGLGWPQSVRIDYSRRTEETDQAIANVTLSGNDDIWGKDLEADWHLAYSRAILDQPDRSTLNVYGENRFDSATGTYAHEPFYVNSSAGTGSPRTWTTSDDQDKSVYLTLKSTEGLFEFPIELSYGGMYRLKNRTAHYDNYELHPNNRNTLQTYNGNVFIDTFTVWNPGGSAQDPLNYTAHENVGAGFAQFNFQVGKVQTIGGVRLESTDFGWESQVPPTTAGKTGSIQYLDVLPSIGFKYNSTENQDWRLSYFSSISRPNFYEVIPSNPVPTESFDFIPNPYLNRTQAQNFDLRWEYFPGGLDQVLFGAFYKNIQDPIEYSVVDSLTVTYIEPKNQGNATNFGFEADIRKYFSDFGIEANYTYTNSKITTEKVVLANFTPHEELQTRPLQGQSENIGNLSLLYKNYEAGVDGQLSAVYTGPAIVAVSEYKDNDVWQNDIFQLDFSAEKKIFAGYSLYFKVTNILNTPLEETIHRTYQQGAYPISNQTSGQDYLVRKEYYDRNFVLGIHFSLE